jgi:hypothetical protein
MARPLLLREEVSPMRSADRTFVQSLPIRRNSLLYSARFYVRYSQPTVSCHDVLRTLNCSLLSSRAPASDQSA